MAIEETLNQHLMYFAKFASK